MRKLLILALVVLLSACAQQQSQNPPPFAGAPQEGSLPQLQYVSIDTLPRAQPPEDMKDLFVEDLANLTPLPYTANTLANDLTIAIPAEATEIMQNLVSSFGALYIDSPNPRIVIDFEVYRFSSPEYAYKVLQAYKTNWNKKKFEHANKTLWVWEGCFTQTQPPMPQGAHIFWDDAVKKASLSSGTAIIGNMAQDLYCYHGEAAFGEYFVMLDIHAPLSEFPALGEKIFKEYLEKVKANQTEIYSGGTELSNTSAGVSKELLEKKKQEITQAYLQGKIPLEVYNYTLSKIEEELRKINGSETK